MEQKNKRLSLKQQKTIKVTVYTLTVIAALNVMYYLCLFFFDLKHNFYTDHFLGPLAIMLIACITMLMAYVNSHTSYSNNTRFDKYMYVLGIIMIATSLIWFMGTFM